MKSVLSIVFILTPIILLAQVEEELLPLQRKQKTVVTEPQTLYKGFVRSGVAFSYGTVDKIFNAEGKRESLPSNIWASSWFLQAFAVYGVSDRLQVEVRLPYSVTNLYQSYSFEFGGSNSVDVVKWNSSSAGLSDMSIGLAYQIVPETIVRPSITTFITGTLPTGEKNPKNVVNDREFKRPAGSGEANLDLRLQMRRIVYPFSYSTSLSYTYFFGGSKILNALDTQERPFKSGNNLNLDATISFHLNDWLAIQNTMTYFNSAKDEFDGVMEENTSWVLQYYPALSFQVKRFRINQTILVPLMGKVGSADPSYIVILSYVF